MQSDISANTSDSAKWLTISEAAHRAGVSSDTIRRRVKSGELRAGYFAGKYRISTTDLDALVAKGEAA
jgi:excisionase family DNA binding protein